MAGNYSFQYEGEEIDALLQKIEELDDATASKSGLMSQADKTKLDGIATGAQENVIESISVGDEDVQVSNKNARIVPDAAPTQNSPRLATSGGIFTAINNVIVSLSNYYLKTETYSKSEVNALVAAIKQFSYQVAETLPTASEDTMYIVYLVPSGNPGAQNIKDEFITVRSGEEGAYTYSWEQIGSTAVDLSGYSTTEEMNAAIATALQSYTTTAALTEMLAKKANTDGWYGGMTVGSAENLVGRGSVEAEYGGIRTSAGSADIGSGSASIVRMKGNSFKWNQLVKNGNFTAKTNWGGVFDVSENIASRTPTTTFTYINQSFVSIPGHKYIIQVTVKTGSYNQAGTCAIKAGNDIVYFGEASTAWRRSSQMITATEGGSGIIYLLRQGSQTDYQTLYAKDVTLTDLTAIFGAGNEPSTVEEFDAWREEMGLTLDYYDYNEGEVINNRAQAIETIGFNRYDASTGKAYLPGKYSDYPQEYEICGAFSSISFKDINGNESVPTLTDGRFFNVDAPGELTVVGGNATDTLVHLVWSGWRNQGEPDYAYEAYWKNRLNIGLTTLKGKLNGAGESVVIFPNGPAKIGDIQDEIVGGKAIRRIGSRAYASGDESDATVMTDGRAFTYYVLTTPEEYILDETQEWNYRVDDFGTEQAIPSYSASGLTAPIAYDVQYAMNAVDAIRRLDKNYVRRDDVKQVAGRSETDVISQKAVDDNYAKKAGVENDLVVGAAKTLAGNQRQVKEFTTMVMDGADGIAKINEVRGRSIVWNQLYAYNKIVMLRSTKTATDTGLILTIGSSGVETGVAGYYFTGFVAGHKIFVSADFSSNTGGLTVFGASGPSIGSTPTRISLVRTVPAQGHLEVYVYGTMTTETQVREDNIRVVDLTLMFGAGNEPSIVEEFEALFPLPYYEYNEGEIISNKTEKLDIRDANEELKATMPLNLSTITGKLNGEGESVTIFPNGMRSAGTAHDYLIVDEDGYARKAVKVIGNVDMGTLSWLLSNNRFYALLDDGKPTGSNIGTNGLCPKYAIVAVGWQLMPNGCMIVGTNFSSSKTSSVVVNDSSYDTAANFKAAMSGVELIYELAEPLTYDLDEPIPMTFMAHHGGTITQTPQAPESAPMVANMTFAIDAVSTLNGLPENYISAASIDNFLSVLSSQMGGTWERTFNATTGKHEFTFTPSSNTNESGL